MGNWRLAVDIGGTFTDVVLVDAEQGTVVVDKTLTTPSAPLEGVQRGVRQLLAKAGVRPEDITQPIVHATTLITNALIEGKTGRAALVTTDGFGDTLLIRSEHRYDMYDLQIEFPPPPIPRSRVFELDERTTAQGVVHTAPSSADLDALTERLAAADVEALAVCFLHAYADSTNERSVAQHLASALDVPVCISAEVAPQIREYQRMVTTACNAATMPVIGPYLDDLQGWLSDEGFGSGVLMMLSNGGVVAATDAKQVPIRLVESGPAAGALAGSWYSRRLGEDRLLCFDMGGTTAKSCLIEGHEPELSNTFEIARIYRFKKGSGFPVSVPSVDLVEIGAGGGSIARVDSLGLLKVGPDSTGADPGPACYGRGGTDAAVTDADLLLGYLDGDWFLGGDMRLDVDAARSAIGKLAVALELSDLDTAAGIHELVNQNMAASARMHGIEHGVDLRGVPLIAFGGAGPVHACGVAELLEATRVVFPVNASVLSAFGTLVSPVRIDLARSKVMPVDGILESARDEILHELRAEGRRVLEGAGISPDDVTFRYGVDARYVGQGNEITIWLPAAASAVEWPVDDVDLVARFESEYTRIFGMAIPDVGVEVVTWRLAASAASPEIDSREIVASPESPAPDRHRPAQFARGVAPVSTPVYRRNDLAAGGRIAGPALIEERETTAVLRPGWDATVLPDGAIVATRSASTENTKEI